jgi:hypothetical protein
LGALAAVALLAGAAVAADEGKWVELLPDGKYQEHWTTEGNWETTDGVLKLSPRPGESGWSRWSSYLWSKKEYEDFEVKFDYKVEPGGNSGFYFRVGNKNSPVGEGIEVQIYASHGKDEAKLTDHDSGGIIPGPPPTKNAAKPQGEWNTFHITNKGDKLTVKLNDVVVNEIDLTKAPLSSRPRKGSIGFQDHALPLWLRNIKIREL